MRGMPYGTHATALLAIGSPLAAASASAFRFASKAAAYGAFRTIGVAGGAASFGSAPRPPRYGAQTPVRSGVCAAADAASSANKTAMNPEPPAFSPFFTVVPPARSSALGHPAS